MDPLTEAMALMRRALSLIDECDDPHGAGPHLDLAIARMEQGVERQLNDSQEWDGQTAQ